MTIDDVIRENLTRMPPIEALRVIAMWTNAANDGGTKLYNIRLIAETVVAVTEGRPLPKRICTKCHRNIPLPGMLTRFSDDVILCSECL